MNTTGLHEHERAGSGRVTVSRSAAMVRMLTLAVLLSTALGAEFAPRFEAEAAETNQVTVCFKYPNGTHYNTENVYLWRYHPSSQNYSLLESGKTNQFGCALVNGVVGQSLKVVAGYSFTPAADGTTRCYFGSTQVFKAENVNRLDKVLSGPGYGTSSSECTSLFRWDG